jgi:lipopolysaccharide transport system ATP-binding protein
MVRGAEILVLSSHSEEIVHQWCTRVMWLDQGRIRDDGPADAVLHRYLGRAPVGRPRPYPAAEPVAQSG